LERVEHNFMKNKSRKVSRTSKLREFKLVPITDPAEQAAIDRRCREAEKVLSGTVSDSGKPKTSKR
jgi:hypothetical protein